MPDIEDRLRCALHDLADEVPTTPDARAGLTRRLTGRRRSPVWAAAAAAVVVAAAVAVPVALSGNSPPATGIGTGGAPSITTSPPAGSSAPVYPGYLMPPTPVVWDRHGEPGGAPHLALSLSDSMMLCWQVMRFTDDPGDTPQRCERLPDLGAGELVVTRAPAEVALDMPPELRAMAANWMVFLASPEVMTIVARRADGTEAPSVMIYADGFESGTLTVGTADFGGPTEGFGYTAYDRDGTVLEEAIT